jgi:hypothetical protein|nr:MAG TPA: hypothetical protein [Caudoviricetes sp.]
MARPVTNPETRFNRAREELETVFAGLDEKRRKTVSKLLDNAAFMGNQLEDLRKEIQKNGVVCEYQNGENQFGTKKSPEVEVYLSMIKNYTQIINNLCAMLPEENAAASALLDFVTKGGTRK